MAQVQTALDSVTGAVASNSLGYTLTHEHLSLDLNSFHCDPPQPLASILKQPRITLENLGYIRQYPYSNIYNLSLHDEDAQLAVRKDLEAFKRFGGGTIVDNTCHGLGRNLGRMHDISVATGVKIVAGTGHYLAAKQTASTLAMTVEQMTDLYSKEIISGVDVNPSLNIKCGFIGEVASGWPLHDFEKKAIKATGEIQEVIGCGVSFHPGFNEEAPFEIVRLYLEAGGKASKCVMSHLDLAFVSDEKLLEFATLGIFTQFDFFGFECSYFQYDPHVDMISDAQRIAKVLKLVAEGRENQVLMSQDIHTKHRLISFGGHGFSHILNNILPRLNVRGLSLEQIDRITIENPSLWLQGKF
ncbi:phosphotriesterase-related protein-like [Phlebotomus argentipes]|uniref:phosphotriesterase-related protein-like n=1 Tax=Phlebotomus argentipes TaxID=94469 RepID=UPI002892EA00|nr:phosphotriesterase-related protein-like [Phlebotomus argentipes]